MAATHTRPNPAEMKVICLGLPRTGTSSMRVALETLGFGPCYDGIVVPIDWAAWCKFGDGLSGHGTPEELDNILRGYRSIVDNPGAIYGRELFAAYPDAKFILTTRDPVQWEASMNATALRFFDAMRNNLVRHHDKGTLMHSTNWVINHFVDGYHGGRLKSDAQQELLAHNERVRSIIPPEKLLVYELGEGWDRLVEFLEVPKPSVPFPHVNTAAEFQKNFLDVLVIKESEDVAS